MKAETLRLINKYKRTANLPSFEETALALERLRLEYYPTTERMVKIVLLDPGLCCQLLRTGNSVFYNPMGLPMKTISRVISLLGYENLKNLAKGPHFSKEDLKNKELNRELAISILAAHFAGKAALKKNLNAEEAYLATLLKRLGRLILLLYSPEYYEKIKSLPPRQRKEAFYVVGEKLAKQWNFPEFILNNLEGREVFIRPKRLEHLCLYADLMAAGIVAKKGPLGWENLFHSLDEVDEVIKNFSKNAGHLPDPILSQLKIEISAKPSLSDVKVGPYLPEEALNLAQKFLTSLCEELSAEGQLIYREGERFFQMDSQGEKEIKEGSFKRFLMSNEIVAYDGRVYLPVAFHKLPAILMVIDYQKPLSNEELYGLRFIKRTLEDLLEKL
ncbi:HDOD domain-containing protein [Thermodesulfatator indicus]